MDEQTELHPQVPAFGWKQFLNARKELLDGYDQAKTMSQKHIVQTQHGVTAEVLFRRWLTSFLPQKFGVSEGYIVSLGIPDTEPVVHFEVIIYDKLESPILWCEGESKAIPAEHVLAVIELKSALSRRTAKESIDQLAKLAPLLGGSNQAGRHKLYLPDKFHSYSVFFELRQDEFHHREAVETIAFAKELRGYSGGIILRCEGHRKPNTGYITRVRFPEWNGNEIDLSGFAVTPGRMVNNVNWNALIQWGEHFFSTFAFSLLRNLNGDHGPLVSIPHHGFGSTLLESMMNADFKPTESDLDGTNL